MAEDFFPRLLGSMIYKSTPQLAPGVEQSKEDGTFIHSDTKKLLGLTEPRFRTPGGVESFLAPELAAQEAGYNFRTRMAPDEALRQLNINKAIAQERYNNFSPDVKAKLGEFNPWFAQTGGALPGSNDEFASKYNQNIADAERNKGEYTRAMIGNLSNIGATQGATDVEGADLALNRAKLANELQPIRANTARLQTGQEYDLYKKVMPYEYSTREQQAKGAFTRQPLVDIMLGNQALAGANESEFNLQRQPYQFGAELNQAKRASAMSPYGGEIDPMKPFVTRVNPDTGRVEMVKNPLDGMSMYGEGGGTPKTMSVGGGLNVALPSGIPAQTVTPAYGASVPQQSSTGYTPPPDKSGLIPVDDIGHYVDPKTKQVYSAQSGQMQRITPHESLQPLIDKALKNATPPPPPPPPRTPVAQVTHSRAGDVARGLGQAVNWIGGMPTYPFYAGLDLLTGGGAYGEGDVGEMRPLTGQLSKGLNKLKVAKDYWFSQNP